MAKRLAKLGTEYDLQARWEGDTCYVEISGATGKIDLTPDQVFVELHLSIWLFPFQDRIGHEVEHELSGLVREKRATVAKKSVHRKS